MRVLRAHTDIEQIDGNHHSQVDQRKHDEDPEANSRDEIWDDLVDGTTGKGEGECGQGGSSTTRCKGEDLCGIDPAAGNCQ
jgi:hypothetical protein